MEEVILRNQVVTRDPRLDRLVKFDERSKGYGIKEVTAGLKPRSYSWRCLGWLDQGNEGACVGFGIGHELIARPSEVIKITNKYARETVYWEAQKIDEWPGGSYPGAFPVYEGSSVLAGVKVVQRIGWIKNYRWAFGLNDLVMGVGHNGPAVMGLAWMEYMMDTDANGYIHAEGSIMGGHCILCRSVNVKRKYFVLHNSWGKSWGTNGECLISFEDMEKLLYMEGEACFFIDRVSSVN